MDNSYTSATEADMETDAHTEQPVGVCCSKKEEETDGVKTVIFKNFVMLCKINFG